MKKLLTAILLIFCIISLPAAAITADEYFEFASGKYFKGDIKGAVKDVDHALLIDPSHIGALELKALIEEERLGSIEGKTGTTITTAAATSLMTTTTLVAATTTSTSPPATIKRFPLRGQLSADRERQKIREAHDMFLRGERYYGDGKLLIARDYFLRVDKLLSGHANANMYLDEINAKLLKAEISDRQLKKLTSRIAIDEFTKRYELRFMWLDGLLLLILFALVGLAVRVVIMWWKTNHIYCPECRARNALDAEFCGKCGVRLKVPDLNDEQKGWFGKFGWTKNPFTLNIIPDIFTGHQVEISIIVEKLNTLSGHILVIGGLGTGKTTLLQWLEKNLQNKFETIYILRPPAKPDELINLVSSTISKRTTSTRAYTIYEFQDLCKKYKRNILLLIDEAHEFKEEFEQFLRTLGDLPNIFLVMAGLPQAREKLKRDLPALFDRIVESLLLGSLNLEETKELIQKRINNAGGKGLGPFTAGAIDKIYDLSYGIPRGILKVCDWVITQAVRSNKTYIDDRDIQAYSEEIKIAKLKDESVSPVARELARREKEREEEENG
ncbi:MAG: AAA family ATPase [Candidatus Margulisiibacteriota bacterium]|nr:AAA family ATPase [Candidatus Margulisiibacteriota bacterium]